MKIVTICSFLTTLCVVKTFASPEKLPPPNPNAIRINKCCEKNEILVDNSCTIANVSKAAAAWEPNFSNENGVLITEKLEHRFAIGRPDCGRKQMWPIYAYPTSSDKLTLLPDGRLRHYIKNPEDHGNEDEDNFYRAYGDKASDKSLFHDYDQGKYCMEKSIQTNGALKQAEYAMVCSPTKEPHWTDTDFLLRKIINPICHGISMTVLVMVAIVYFVLPSLRDLVGNIVTTITLCLIISQAADLVRIFTEFDNHVNFFVADIIMYVSLLAAFFWLNSMGYYIWKTFRSRNVFLRVTDGRKYCWYSAYVWFATSVMAGLAIFAHIFLDTQHNSATTSFVEEQDTMGWLGVAIFFTPVAFIILINIFFYATTLQIIGRMSTYGRIHHKLKASFVMFSLMFLIMSIAWLFLILSWLNIEGLLYAHIVVNALQAPCLMYVCILRQKHVKYLLKKTCCYNEPPAATDWGDEMTYMNGGDY